MLMFKPLMRDSLIVGAQIAANTLCVSQQKKQISHLRKKNAQHLPLQNSTSNMLNPIPLPHPLSQIGFVLFDTLWLHPHSFFLICEKKKCAECRKLREKAPNCTKGSHKMTYRFLANCDEMQRNWTNCDELRRNATNCDEMRWIVAKRDEMHKTGTGLSFFTELHKRHRIAPKRFPKGTELLKLPKGTELHRKP